MNHLSPLVVRVRSTLACARLDRSRVGNLGLLIVLIALTLVVTTALAIAQGPAGTGQPRAPRANAGTAFTYQGQLKNGGSVVNGTCDFQFGLWDDANVGTQIGTTQSVSGVNVTNGLFTTPIDFGAGMFDGNARWLSIAVKCGSETVYTPFTSRQTLTPTPMALALPGLYTHQNATSPNLIGGYSGNVISTTVVGSVIGGGGQSGLPNRVWANYATVSGGYANTASAFAAVVGGGETNNASNGYATIGGGALNVSSGNYAAICGGRGNIASGASATIGGGWGNIASGAGAFVGGGGKDGATVDSNQAVGDASTISGGLGNSIPVTGTYATIGGGKNNAADNRYATVGGGDGNTAYGSYTTVGGGLLNMATSSYSTIGGGIYNWTSDTYATVPGGAGASASHYGEMAYASGYFSSLGDAQTSLYVVHNTTTNATQTELFLDGIAKRITIANIWLNGRTVTFDILVVARSDSGLSAGYRIAGVIRYNNGTTAFIGTPTITTLGENSAGWDVTVGADDSYEALVVKVMGATATMIRWVASVRTVEVAW